MMTLITNFLAFIGLFNCLKWFIKNNLKIDKHIDELRYDLLFRDRLKTSNKIGINNLKKIGVNPDLLSVSNDNIYGNSKSVQQKMQNFNVDKYSIIFDKDNAKFILLFGKKYKKTIGKISEILSGISYQLDKGIVVVSYTMLSDLFRGKWPIDPKEHYILDGFYTHLKRYLKKYINNIPFENSILSLK